MQIKGMAIRSRWAIISVFAIILLFSSLNTAEAKPVISQGVENGHVYDIQYRLHQLGYYNDDLDGKFGANTLNAVKRFQNHYGLTSDGVVGENTWNVLYRHTFTEKDMDLMTRLVSAEAKGEPFEGQVAVAEVVLNRLDSPLFPDTISEIVYQPLAFEVVANGTIWQPPKDSAKRAVFSAIRGWQPAYGSLYFFNPVTSTSEWIWSRETVTRIGDHIFAK